MSNLEEIKGNYARSIGYDAWGNFLREESKADLLLAMNIIAKEYAKAKLEEANEEIIKHAKRSAANDGDQWDGGYLCAVIDSEIIINKILKNQ